MMINPREGKYPLIDPDRGKIVSDSVCNAASDITFITVMLHQTQPHYQATALLRRAGAVR